MTTKRHHYVFAGTSPPEFEWHSGLRQHCSICLNDENGNKPPHPFQLHPSMILVERHRNADPENTVRQDTDASSGEESSAPLVKHRRNTPAKSRVEGSPPARTRQRKTSPDRSAE
jgi:hypothetical protein